MEPVYSYVKGQGWVAYACNAIVITLKGGDRVRIYERQPEIGELFFYIGKDSIVASNYSGFEDYVGWVARSSRYRSALHFRRWEPSSAPDFTNYYLYAVEPL